MTITEHRPVTTTTNCILLLSSVYQGSCSYIQRIYLPPCNMDTTKDNVNTTIGNPDKIKSKSDTVEAAPTKIDLQQKWMLEVSFGFGVICKKMGLKRAFIEAVYPAQWKEIKGIIKECISNDKDRKEADDKIDKIVADAINKLLKEQTLENNFKWGVLGLPQSVPRKIVLLSSLGAAPAEDIPIVTRHYKVIADPEVVINLVSDDEDDNDENLPADDASP